MGASTSPSISGAILLFEANATMVVEQPDGDPCWDYRRTAVERIHVAVRDLLLTRVCALPHPIVLPTTKDFGLPG
jgi:hypothetical protein